MSRSIDRQLHALASRLRQPGPVPPELAEQSDTPPASPARHVWRYGEVLDGLTLGQTAYYEEGGDVVGVYFKEVDRIYRKKFVGSGTTNDDDDIYQLTHAIDMYGNTEHLRPAGTFFCFVYDRVDKTYRIISSPDMLGWERFHRTWDATDEPPQVGDLIEDDPPMVNRSLLTGLQVNGSGQLEMLSRTVRRRNDGTFELEDDDVTKHTLTITRQGEFYVFVLDAETSSP